MNWLVTGKTTLINVNNEQFWQELMSKSKKRQFCPKKTWNVTFITFGNHKSIYFCLKFTSKIESAL